MGRAARQGLVEVLLALGVLALGVAGAGALWGEELRALVLPSPGPAPRTEATGATR